ncbi:MAG: EamA/RhaT family transporter [Novosphingobium sp.]
MSSTVALLWVPFTLIAAVAQLFRNGAQAGLTAKIGTLGATQVRFVFGLPFAVLFLAMALAISGDNMPAFTPAALGWTLAGALCQIGGTAMMLVVMGQRAFGVAYAYIKTEPAIVALLGVVLLGDHLPLPAWLAVGVVTLGVLLASVKPGEWAALLGETRMIGVGILSGGLYGASAIAFRGAIEALPQGTFILRSLAVLVATLGVQTALLGCWLAVRDRPAFMGSLREWRSSFGAGFAGALASAGFFIAFSLTPAANVRTLALVELPLAAVASGRVSGKRMARHELAGLAVVMAGVALLLAAHAA